jgi:hypothetical protein
MRADLILEASAAGAPSSQASPATILEVDLYGTALVLADFGNVIAAAAGVVIAQASRSERARSLG